jgi:hypothetical protein
LIREADYIVEKISTTYYARAAAGSGLSDYSGAAFATVFQNAINALTPAGAAGSGGGHIHILEGDYQMQAQVTITGWEGVSNNYSSLKITGIGFSTHIMVQGTNNKGLVVKNRANIIFKDFYMSVNAASTSAIRLEGDGADSERSVNKGIIDGVWINSGGNGAAFYATNFFNLNCPWLRVECTTNHAVHLEGTSTSVYYGNATFGYLQANGSDTEPYAGLAITTAAGVGVKAINLISIQGLYVGSGFYGYYLDGARFITASFADIEYVGKPVYITGSSGKEAVGNSILSGYLYSDETTGYVITAGQYSEGNKITAYVQTDSASTNIIDDDGTLSGNDYDLTLSPDADETKVAVVSPQVTRVRLRRRDNALLIDSHGGPVYKFLAADVANSTTSYADITGLSFPVKSGSTYKFKFYVHMTSAAATTGAGLALTFPDNPTKISYVTTLPVTNASSATWQGYTGEDLPAAAQTTFPGNFQGTGWIEGLIKPSADGTVQARIMSEVAASAVTAKADLSYVEYQLIA